jgi:hypothetical protein
MSQFIDVSRLDLDRQLEALGGRIGGHGGMQARSTA